MNKPLLIGYVGIRDLPMVTEKDCRALDVINLAFGHVENGAVVCDMLGNEKELQRIRKIHPEIRIVLSIGGWSAGGFSPAAATEEGRNRFAQTALEIVRQYELDGIDIDWEYPCMSVAGIEASPNDKENYTLLLKVCREALDTLDRRTQLSIAAGGDSYFVRCTQMDELQKYLEYVQLMSYDLRGGFCYHTGHHANLYTRDADLCSASADEAVKCYHDAGVPLEKLILGAAFYSRQWTGVPDVDHGMMQMAQSTGGYGPTYTDLEENYVNKNGYTRYWDDQAKAPWLFNGSTFISYDDKESIGAKVNYLKEQGLGGLMYWEYGNDEHSVLTSWIREEMDR